MGPRLNGAVTERELAERAARQDGLVARHQARDHLTRRQLGSRLATGRLVVLRRDVYGFPGAPAGPRHDWGGEVELGVPAAAVACHQLATTNTLLLGQLRHLGLSG